MQILCLEGDLPGSRLTGITHQNVEASLHPLDRIGLSDAASGQIGCDQADAVNHIRPIQLEGNTPQIRAVGILHTVCGVIGVYVLQLTVHIVVGIGGSHAVLTVNQLDRIRRLPLPILIEAENIKISHVGGGSHYVLLTRSHSGQGHSPYQSNSGQRRKKSFRVHTEILTVS